MNTKAAAEEREDKHSIKSQLLLAITRAQTQFVQSRDTRAVFDGLLDALLNLTESEYGFIGEVLHDDDNTPYLKTHAITNIAWNRETQQFYDDNASQGLEFRNMDTLFGSVITTGETVIANAPATDRRGSGIPEGHPPLEAFLGLPFFHRENMIGMVGIANRSSGYDQELVDSLKPFLTTCSNIILSLRGQTEQAAVERSLRESEARGRAILDNAIDAIITIDLAGNIESCNRAAGQIFGYGANELLGMNVTELMPDHHARHHAGYIEDYVRTGRGKIIGLGRELTARRRDGSEFPVELAVNELKLEGRQLFVGMLRDITERKTNEQQRGRLNAELTARVEELDRLSEENSMLSELGSYLQVCVTKEEAYEVLLAHARALFRENSGALYRLAEGASAECVLSWGAEQEGLQEPVQKQDCWALRRGELHESGSGWATLRCRHHSNIGNGCQICVPVMTQNGPIGLLTLHMPKADEGKELAGCMMRSRSILSGIADRLGPTLSGIELRTRLHEDSIRDPLTRLYNRRFLEDTLRRELLRARRIGASLSVIMLDLDKFKRINDEYGHDIGDQVLIMLAHQLGQVVREEDIVYRYGGEEFVIVLPGANLDVAKERAMDARRAAKTMRIETDNGPLHVTLSAGVATYPDHGNTGEELIVQADKALYVAKQSGRDRVRLAS
jgi:diguanylate cyclase (GGDEF)-like protein/PAS domain S-box-containing protein